MHTTDPVSTAHTLWGTVPMPKGYDGPICVGDLPTESRRIYRGRTHDVFEVAAACPRGAASIPITERNTRPSESLIDPEVTRALFNPGTIQLVFEDQAGRFFFSLTGTPETTGFQRWHRAGRIMRTSEHFVSLGRFGHAKYWLTTRAHSRQVDVEFLWHNGIPGSSARIFRRVGTRSVGGTRVWNLLTDPSWNPQTGALVKQEGGPHVIPQAMGRLFRFAVTPDDLQPLGHGWATGDWSRGGYLVSGFPIPSMPGVSYTREIADARTWLRNVEPSFGGAHDPVSHVFPASGVQYGGMTSGTDMIPLDGQRLAMSGERDGLELHAIQQLRSQARARMRYEADGSPMNVDAHPFGDWRYFDFQPEANRQTWQPDEARYGGPWRMPEGYPTGMPYDPRVFAPDDCQHQIRANNDDKALAWLANDPLAVWRLRGSAGMNRAIFYTGSGQAARIGAPTPQGGTDFGRAHAWAMDCIQHDQARADLPRPHQPWLNTMVSHLAVSQPVNGLWQASTGYKEASLWPFSPDPTQRPFRIGSGREHAFLALVVLQSAGDPASMLSKLAVGMRDLAWPLGKDAPMAWYPAGPAAGGWWVTRADFDPELAARMAQDPGQAGVDGYSSPYMLAAIKAAGVDVDELFLRFTRTTSVAQGVAALRARPLVGNLPCEQWLPALGVWGT